MTSPEKLISSVIQRVSEIIWWNRGLTKLKDNPDFLNAEDFISNLLEKDGPYVEYVRPPARSDEFFSDFCERLEMDRAVSSAFDQILFHGSGKGRLYQHQAEAIETIMSDEDRDVIISVPTATGKTECFLVPIINHCASSRSNGLKSILIYPLKTLEVDQLNRILKILDDFNQRSGIDRKIQIGIWDGDTPETRRLDDSADEAYYGSTLRGIVCPKCREKLLLGRDDILYCNRHGKFHWIKATRRAIRNASRNIDILITNPESLDFLMLSSNREVKTLLGQVRGSSPVKYIVLDEAHIWRGIQGSHINLLITRLRHFYNEINPKIILSSATIGDPKSFAEDLLGDRPLSSILFKWSETPEPETFDYSRISPCSFRDLIEIMLRSQSVDIADMNDLGSHWNNALMMAETLGLMRSSNGISVTEDGRQFLRYMEPRIGSIEHILDDVILSLINSIEFQDYWQGLIGERLPEVYALIGEISAGDSPLVFKKASLLSRRIRESVNDDLSQEEADEILACLLSFGRSCNLLIDKYHVFLKPITNIYWCKKDRVLSLRPTCSLCHSQTIELRFCPDCHEPIKLTEIINSKEDSDDQREEIISPTDHPMLNKAQDTMSDDDQSNIICPNCASEIEFDKLEEKLEDIRVHYTTFVSFLLSALCKETYSRKAIVFSDGRMSAEGIALRLVDLDYSLVAEQLYVQHLLSQPDWKSSFPKIMFNVWNKLRDYYVKYMLESVDSEDSKNVIKTFFEENVKTKAYLSNSNHLLDYGIITVADSYENLSSTVDLMILQEIIKIYLKKKASFQTKNVKFSGLPLSKLVERIERRLPKLPEGCIKKRIREILIPLMDSNVLSIAELDDVIQELDDGVVRLHSEGERESRIASITEELRKYSDELRKELDIPSEKSKSLSGLIVDSPHRTGNEFFIQLVDKNVICLECYAVYPAKEEDISSCPKCGGQLIYGSRFGGASTQGVLETPLDGNWPLDHWGKDIVKVAVDYKDEDLPRVVTWVHRAGIKPDIRGAIEDGFRSSVPSINVVSSTPTLELGIDIGSLDCVIQIGFPPTLTNYVQRSGRTGRARGRPSYVFTILRNDHSVDTYYMNNMDTYFSALRPIQIPDPLDYLPVQAPHVVTECCAFLSRNMPSSEYNRIYWINESGMSDFSTQVMTRFNIILKLVTDPQIGYSESIQNHIQEVFGNLEAFNEVFCSDRSLSLMERANSAFRRLSEVENADYQIQLNFSRKNSTLGNWLSIIGLIAQYRGLIGKPVPLVLRGQLSSEIEMKTEDQVISEAYPGQDNKNGGIFYYETVRYIVDRAKGGTNILKTTKICSNPDCDLPFQSYEIDMIECPLCGKALENISVYSIDQIVPKKYKQSYFTYPFISTTCDMKQIEKTVNSNIGRVDIEIIQGYFDYVTFTPAFRRTGGRARPGGNIYRSEAEIPSGKVIKTGEIDVKEWLKGGGEGTKGPLGYEDSTEGLMFKFPLNEALVRLDGNWKSLLIAAFSFSQALKRATAVTAQCEMQDSLVSWSIGEDTINFFILDGRSGGNGISRYILTDLLSKNSMFKLVVEKTVKCQRECGGYCDSCLLLSRTPEKIVSEGFLDRFTLGRFIGMGISR